MRNKFFLYPYIALLTIAFSILAVSCEDDEKEPVLAPSVVLDRVITASSDELVVTFTPSETTTRYIYAIGDESDRDAFVSGTFSGIREVEGNDVLTVTFPDLEESRVYAVFARAYNVEGTSGPLASIKAKTRKPIDNFTTDRQYLTDNSVAFSIKASNEYYKFDFALGKSIDKAVFEAGVIDGFTTKEEISEYTANYFALNPETEYTFFVRGYDRQSGQVSETREFNFVTPAKGSVPSVAFNIDYIDLYSGDYTFTPNEHCGRFAVFVALKDEYKTVIEEEVNWRGNILVMMESWTSLNQNLTTASEEGPLTTSHVTNTLISGEVADPFGYPMEAYILLYDKDNKVYGVQRYEFQSPSYDDNMGKAEVKLKISNISTNGAFYEFEPNEYTMGYVYETFDAEWYENLLQSSSYYDGYIEYFLFTQGYWSYCHKVPSATIPERTAEPGKRYYVFYLPMNYNGPNGGWGELQTAIYTTLEEKK